MKLLFYLSLTLICSILHGQEVDPKEEMKKALKAASEASKAMEESEKSLAEASREKTRPDVLHERIKRIIQQLKDGKLDELPPGLEDYLKSKGKPVDLEAINNDPEFLKKIAEDSDLFDILSKKLLEAENNIQEDLKNQQNASDNAIKKMEESLDAITKGASGDKNSQIDNNKKGTADPKDKSTPQSGSDQKPDVDNKSGKNPEPNDSDFESKQVDKSDPNAFQAPSKDKDMGPGNSGDGPPSPPKYKGFWQKWSETIQKRTKYTKKEKE